MPIIQYKCKNEECQHEFEVFYTSQSKRQEEEEAEQCPKCDSTEKEPLPPKGTGFVLKGRGWYRDGY